MVNSKKFSERLQKIMDRHELSASAFADSIEVGRSSISHILSGRNKPSLEFVLKIVQKYPEVELYWLLNGKGTFPAQDSSTITPTPKMDSSNPQNRAEKGKIKTSQFNTPSALSEEKTIQKIVIFYNDGSFEAFEN